MKPKREKLYVQKTEDRNPTWESGHRGGEPRGKNKD